MAITFTQADLDALKEAFVTGALEVQIGDRRVVYRSQKDLLAAMKMIEDAVTGVSDDIDDNPNVVQAGYSRSQCDE